MAEYIRIKSKGLIKLRLCLAVAIIMCLSCLGVTLYFCADSAQEACFLLGSPYCKSAFAGEIGDKADELFNIVESGGTSPVEQTPSKDVQNIFARANSGDDPTILIYHTHTLEAYTPTLLNPYIERCGKWRTTDNSKNVVAVGEALAEQLRSYGFCVLHDTTNHEPPKLSTAYSRSEQTMVEYKNKYPSLVMFIDLHRDASGEDGGNDYCTINNEQVARVMFVTGTGVGAMGTGFAQMPDFESNHALAEELMGELTQVNERLVRPIRVKPGRYNQHISNQCLLIEFGHNMNTLEQALASTKYVAKAIAQVCDAA